MTQTPNLNMNPGMKFRGRCHLLFSVAVAKSIGHTFVAPKITREVLLGKHLTGLEVEVSFGGVGMGIGGGEEGNSQMQWI